MWFVPIKSREQQAALALLTRTGMAVRRVHSNGTAATAGTLSSGLIKYLLQAREWWLQLASGETAITTIATTAGINEPWVLRVVRLNFLAPQLVEEPWPARSPHGSPQNLW